MKAPNLLSSLALLTLSATTAAAALSPRRPAASSQWDLQQQQDILLPPRPPLGKLPVMAPSSPAPGSGSGSSSSDAAVQVQRAVPLGDILGSQRALTTFASLTRLEESTTTLLDDLATNTTVLAPLNSAIEALPRKPWEDAREYAVHGAQAYDGSGGQDRAARNLRHFVDAHLVACNPWEEGVRAKTLGGRVVWWEWKKQTGDDDGDRKRIIMPDKVLVDRVASQVANGELVSLNTTPSLLSFGLIDEHCFSPQPLRCLARKLI